MSHKCDMNFFFFTVRQKQVSNTERKKAKKHYMQMRRQLFIRGIRRSAKFESGCACERERWWKIEQNKVCHEKAIQSNVWENKKYILCNTGEAFSSSATGYLQMTAIHNEMTVNIWQRCISHIQPRYCPLQGTDCVRNVRNATPKLVCFRTRSEQKAIEGDQASRWEEREK